MYWRKGYSWFVAMRREDGLCPKAVKDIMELGVQMLVLSFSSVLCAPETFKFVACNDRPSLG